MLIASRTEARTRQRVARAVCKSSVCRDGPMQRKTASPNGPAFGERDNVVVLPLPASTSVSQPRANPGAIPGRRMRRRKSTVLSADVAGYTRLMEADEEETHERLMWILAT